MDPEIKTALKQFFAAQDILDRHDVINSNEYIEDIKKYLCVAVYDMQVSEKNLAAYDGTIGIAKIQVRFNNCAKGTKVTFHEEDVFHELVVILGPDSLLRPEGIEAEFIFYRFKREDALELFKEAHGIYTGDRAVFAEGHDTVLTLT
jgi:hypothetical protein